MTSTAIADGSRFRTGRSSEQVYAFLRESILSGQAAVGQFLPTERQMAEEHGVAHTTVRRALGRLQADGLIRAEPRKGYRVLSLANDPARGCPVAYIRSDAQPAGSWDDFHRRLVGEIQTVAGRRGWALLTLGAGASGPSEVIARLKAARAFGVILDTDDEGVVRAVREARLPALMLDSWVEGCGMDSVMQDGHHGGLLAARFLAGKGGRRIAWFGPTDRNAHTMDRFGGFAAGLLGEGLALPPDLIFTAGESSLDDARRMLAGPKRPDAVAALWQVYAPVLRRAADELGLTLGRDLQLVSWSPEEQYDGEYVPKFAGGPVMPAVTWSIRAMAEAAVAVLVERRANPALPPLRVRIPASLKPGA